MLRGSDMWSLPLSSGPDLQYRYSLLGHSRHQPAKNFRGLSPSICWYSWDIRGSSRIAGSWQYLVLDWSPSECKNFWAPSIFWMTEGNHSWHIAKGNRSSSFASTRLSSRAPSLLPGGWIATSWAHPCVASVSDHSPPPSSCSSAAPLVIGWDWSFEIVYPDQSWARAWIWHPQKAPCKWYSGGEGLGSGFAAWTFGPSLGSSVFWSSVAVWLSPSSWPPQASSVLSWGWCAPLSSSWIRLNLRRIVSGCEFHSPSTNASFASS